MGEALDRTFRSPLTKSSAPGGWTYVVMEDSAAFFGTRGLVRVRGTVDGTHKLPVKSAVRRAVHKESGATMTVHLDERLTRR